MRLRIVLTAFFLALCGAVGTSAQSLLLTAVNLTTESRHDPMGVSTHTPMFGWLIDAASPKARNVRQSGYRIRLATSVASLSQDATWDSGMVADAVYWQRPYKGPRLASHTTYYWQVQLRNGEAAPGPWSKPDRFTTGLFSEEDWDAQWIAAQPDGPPPVKATEQSGDTRMPQPPPLPLFRHEFSLDKPVAGALLYVVGLGQYEVHINGKNVTDTVLTPGWTDYRKTVAYNTYDVTGLVRREDNAIGVLLGNGMYNVEGVQGHYTKFVGSFGQPKCLLQLEIRYTDGSSARVVSDGSWKTHAGPVVYSSTFGGEEFDARMLPAAWDMPGFAEDKWHPVAMVTGPGGKLSADQSSPMVVAQSYRTVRVTHPRAGTTVYDLGQNMSGWPRIMVSGPAGSKVRMLPGELLNEDGTVTQRSAAATAEEPVLFSYTLRGGKQESWHPRFAYYSFRYVQVTTEAAPGEGRSQPAVLSLEGDFVHAKAPIVGEFHNSNKLFQDIHVLIDRAVLSNLASVVTDCPSREKLGWLEQTYLNAATLMLNYDVTGLYEKMSDDIRDAQLENGLVPSIAPEFVSFVDSQGRSTAFRDSPEWGSAAILSPWALYKFTGDMRPLITNYPAMKRYAAYLKSRLVNGLLNYGLGDWYDIGPKEPGVSQLTSKTVTATGVYYEDLVTLADIARLLGNTQDAETYTAEAAQVAHAFNTALFKPDKEEYDRGSQTANAVALVLGLVPAGHVQGVLNHLVADIEAHGNHVTAGDIGFHYVVRALTNYGRSDVLRAMFLRTDRPSYGYQLAKGATTLTEAWDANPASSQNHFMLGHGEEWFYRGLAGIVVDMSQGPDKAIQLQPSFLAGITYASGSYRSAMGQVTIAWKRSANGSSVDITVPAGARANLKLPSGMTWRDTLNPMSASVPVSELKNHNPELQLGSGTYHFYSSSTLVN